MIISFTGHRPTKLGGYNIPNPTYLLCIEAIKKSIIQFSPEKVLSGMALGIDQWVVSICIDLKIPFVAAIPFEDQEKAWPASSQKQFNDYLLHASEVKYICDPGYAYWKMQKRNEWLVDNSDILIGIWNGTNSGTKNCIDYAIKNNKTVYIIDPNNNFTQKKVT